MTSEDIINLMKEAEIMIDFDSFKPEVTFVDQGVDSLDLASLFFLIEEKSGVKLDDSEIEGLRSVTDIVAFLEKGNA